VGVVAELEGSVVGDRYGLLIPGYHARDWGIIGMVDKWCFMSGRSGEKGGDRWASEMRREGGRWVSVGRRTRTSRR
jgi:hypothetical protein